MKASEEVKRTVWIERSWLNDTVFKSLTISQHHAVWVEDYEVERDKEDKEWRMISVPYLRSNILL